MAAFKKPTKFVQELSSYLLCAICKNVFRDPVISISCGHSFCRGCVSNGNDNNSAKCPSDSVTIDQSRLVVNRAILAQIEDLQIYCCHGLVWSAEKQDYVTDPEGCQVILEYGNRELHEEECDYMCVPCPNNETECSKIRRRDTDQHLIVCAHNKCSNHNKGCTFHGTSAEMTQHELKCRHQGPTDHLQQIWQLEDQNKALEDKVKALQTRVGVLELEKEAMATQMNKCLSAITALEEKHESVVQTVDQMQKQPLYRRASRNKSVSPTSPPSHMSRACSTSSLQSQKLESWTMPFTFKCIGTLRGHSQSVECLAHHQNMVYSGGKENVIKVWDMTALAEGCKHTIEGHTAPVTCVAVGMGHLYSASDDLTLRVWCLNTFEEKWKFDDCHEKSVCSMVIAGEFLFTASHSVIKVWQCCPLTHKHTITGLHHWVRALAVNHAQDKLYGGCHNSIEVWSTVEKFSLRGKISHKFGSVHSIALTEKYIIAGTYNRNIELFDIQTQQYVKHLSAHIGSVTAIVTSPSGRFMFTSSADNTVQIWNLENMLPIQSLNRHEAGVNSIILCDDYLLSGSEDSYIKVFKHYKMQIGFGFTPS